jgi:hypothetical protein
MDLMLTFVWPALEFGGGCVVNRVPRHINARIAGWTRLAEEQKLPFCFNWNCEGAVTSLDVYYILRKFILHNLPYQLKNNS